MIFIVSLFLILFGLFCGFWLITIGLGLLLVPLIGWVLGPIFIFVGIMFPIVFSIKSLTINRADITPIRAQCPNCGNDFNYYKRDKAKTCKYCHHRMVIKQSRNLTNSV